MQQPREVFSFPFIGLDQKKAALVRGPGTLDEAHNVEFEKTGEIRKRRGYQFVPFSPALRVFDADAVFEALAVYRNELLVFSYDHVLGLMSRDALVNGDRAFVYRGPAPRGALRVHFVAGARVSGNS